MTSVTAGSDAGSDAGARSGSADTARSAGYREVLRRREFSGLLSATAVSEWGDAAARVAVASLILTATHSVFLAATTFAVSYLPPVAGGLLLGSLADRLPRRRVIMVADLARGVLMLVLAWLAIRGPAVPVLALLVVLFASQLFTAPFDAAYSAMVPDLLPDPREYLVGSGLMRVLSQLDQVIGLVLGGLVVSVVHAAGALAFDAATFGLSFLLVAVLVRARPAPAEERVSFGLLLADLRAGSATIAADPVLRVLILLGWSATFFLLAPEAVALGYARDQGRSALAGSLLLAAVPAGATLGALLVGRLAVARQIRAILPLAAAACLPLLLTGLDLPVAPTVGLWAVAGACQGFMIPLIATSMLVTPAQMRGRVGGIAAAGFSVSSGVSFLVVGALADQTSPSLAVMLVGAFGLVTVGLYRLFWPRAAVRRAIRRTYEG